MIRLRRFRVLVAFVVFAILLLWHATRENKLPLDTEAQYASKVPAWYRPHHDLPDENTVSPSEDKKVEKEQPPPQKEEKLGPPKVHNNVPNKQEEVEAEVTRSSASTSTTTATSTAKAKVTKVVLPDLKTDYEYPGSFAPSEEDAMPATPTPDTATVLQTPPPSIPDMRPGGVHDIYDQGSGPQQAPLEPEQAAVHWEKQVENYPVAIEDLIHLPTGTPKKMPQIQFNFGTESEEAKAVRLERLAKVKGEMAHAWSGYKAHAWMHDELSPVSLKFRDPFCGWAATLVDALDTLFIMGMTKEFDEAVDAVADIDFTITPRNEIPVFETTIRYLGGFLGAYDVSSGRRANEKYSILLKKAEELAEILMGVFDTPNRMPILYYNWRPNSVSQPKMAATHAGVAELGTLAMEFTRLAQITGKDRYYDAIARITDAFEDLMNRGTTLPGLFPQNLDTSGCNRTATTSQVRPGIVVGPSEVKGPGEPVAYYGEGDTKNEPKNSTAETVGKSDVGTSETVKSETESELTKRDSLDRAPLPEVTTDSEAVTDDNANVPKTMEYSKASVNVQAAESPENVTPHQNTGSGPTDSTRIPQPMEPSCVKQGLIPAGWGMESYSIGANQDSTYEYFPKQWLLLGGLEPKYKEMAIKAADAVKKWLLYRPMVPDSRDILFSAKVSTSQNREPDYEFEVTHLSCFIGGMFGMGGKIFERPEDVEIGAKLTEGCFWAYEIMPSGIMPESARVVPCKDAGDCPWNETLWYEWLDPMAATRDKQVADYDERVRLDAEKQKLEEEQAAEAARKQEAAFKQAEQFRGAVKAEAERQAKDAQARNSSEPARVDTGDFQISQDQIDSVLSQVSGADVKITEAGADENRSHDRTPLNKRDITPESALKKRDSLDRAPAPIVGDDEASDALGEVQAERKAKEDAVEAAHDAVKEEQATTLEPNTDVVIPTKTTNSVTQDTAKQDPEKDPYRPLTHVEWVANRIKQEKLPKGFTTMLSKHYILRPEAIESVWYMYRITGDVSWQEKGWKMFEAIIKHTKTEAGHSAIDDVTLAKPQQKDEMESFWLAETLKYFYLLFAEPDVVSLDEWVLNTEAHPFKRPIA